MARSNNWYLQPLGGRGGAAGGAFAGSPAVSGASVGILTAAPTFSTRMTTVSITTGGVMTVDTPIANFTDLDRLIYPGQTIKVDTVTYNVVSITDHDTAVVTPAPGSAVTSKLLYAAIGVTRFSAYGLPLIEIRSMQNEGLIDRAGTAGSSIALSGSLRFIEPIHTLLSNTALSVLSRTATDPDNISFYSNAVVTWTSAVLFDVVVGSTTVATGVTYNPAGTTIAYAGWSVVVAGTAAAGYTLTIKSAHAEFGFENSGSDTNGLNLVTDQQFEFWCGGGVSLRQINTGYSWLQCRTSIDGAAAMWIEGGYSNSGGVKQASGYIGYDPAGGGATGFGLGFGRHAQGQGAARVPGMLFNNFGFAISNSVARNAGDASLIPASWSAANCAQLLLDGVTTAAGSAPLKLKPSAAAAKLTTAEDGAFEYDGTLLYFTVGATRKTVTLI